MPLRQRARQVVRCVPLRWLLRCWESARVDPQVAMAAILGQLQGYQTLAQRLHRLGIQIQGAAQGQAVGALAEKARIGNCWRSSSGRRCTASSRPR